jgi:thiol:disulfide interchange protein
LIKKNIVLGLLCLVIFACKSSKKIRQAAPDKEKTDPPAVNKILFDFVDAPLLAEVLAEAKKEKKWIFMDIGAKWCAPCQLMKRDVYTHKETAAFFNKNFILYLVDGEKNEGPDLRIIFDVKSYPTLLFIDENGKPWLRMESGIGASALMEYGQSALVKKKEMK